MASGLSTRGGTGRCYGFFEDFKRCFHNLRRPHNPKEKAEFEAAEALFNARSDSLKTRLNERLEANPKLGKQFSKIQESVYSDPEVAALAAKIEKTEDGTEIQRLNLMKFSTLLDSKPEWQEAISMIPEVKEMQALEHERVAKPHPVAFCMDSREDYLECLHGRKYLARLAEMDRVRTLKEKGLWPEKGVGH